ncbi:hypothetical protein BN1723_013986 [Verticillium longisporum]|uniref:GPN-loop GTPase 2 n=1 Tax=Verticillium longisporum TaxID=100787 RepID=A0A0G4LZT8_VERLO|nr:hypothetical protein BN1723_013986 [Verticillium longisporum]
MPFAQLVLGSPGAGKSTYCDGMHQFLSAIGRACSVVNLDPANENANYPKAIDIRSIAKLEDIMARDRLGPNGGILYALEELEHNIDWLEEGLKELGDDYVIFDCPGQVELYTHHSSLRNIFLRLQKLGYRLVVVHLSDSFCLTQPSLYISNLLLSLRAMLQMDLPHINVPGVSSFADKPEDIGPEHLKALVELALAEVPASKVAETPIYLMATAGMRLLPKTKQQELLQSMCTYLRDNTDFSLPDCNTNIQVISGETEGLYGWLGTNYLLGGFDEPQNHQHGQGHHTYGFLDMGGASAQIAFAPNSTEAKKHSNDLKLVRLRTMDGTVSEHKVFTATWLGYGANQARERYVDRLQELYDKSSNLEVPDPCMPKGLRTTPDGDPLTDKQAKKELT